MSAGNSCAWLSGDNSCQLYSVHYPQPSLGPRPSLVSVPDPKPTPVQTAFSIAHFPTCYSHLMRFGNGTTPSPLWNIHTKQQLRYPLFVTHHAGKTKRFPLTTPLVAIVSLFSCFHVVYLSIGTQLSTVT